MSLVLSGTDGLSDVDGTAAAPAIRGTDANTGIFFPAADNIAFAEGGTEVMRIDSSGNVGIGTSSPSFALHVQRTSANAVINIDTVTSGNAILQFLNSGNATSSITQDRAANNMVITNGSSGAMTFVNNGSERARIDSSGNVGIGTTSPNNLLTLNSNTANTALTIQSSDTGVTAIVFGDQTDFSRGRIKYDNASEFMAFETNDLLERMRITSGGYFCVGTTTQSTSSSTNGFVVGQSGETQIYRDSAQPLVINRNTNDGALVSLRQADIEEGNISVSGSTVSYNGGHLSRWAQTTTPKDDTLVKGTVLSNLDEMNVYTDADGNPVENEQLNKVKVSDVEGDANVAGVFVNWSHDEDHNVDEINMAMTGDMIIRIAQGTTVARGDLLMSAGDGTAKPQGDDIVRSKTVAKVTSTHVTCTYADGSYCVPCVLMAC